MTTFRALDVTKLDRDAFIETFGGIYEHAPWIAARAYDMGVDASLNEVETLRERMARILDEADHESQLTVIRAHPDLAGKAAVAGELTDSSRREQAGAGIDQCSPEEFAEFERLNDAYKKRFGFPFIIAVAGLDRYAILEAFRTRIEHDRETERRTALVQVHRIAANRLAQMT